jgi:hypothetical protein
VPVELETVVAVTLMLLKVNDVPVTTPLAGTLVSAIGSEILVLFYIYEKLGPTKNCPKAV